ncbi:MAG TPA: NAD(+)/NADH kinase [Phycisphaerae bacterium]|nr:NAD(+)/NADH kinase [Phycisphaerae bacterium]
MKIALVPNPEKADAMAAAQDLLEELTARAHCELLPKPTRAGLSAFGPDLVIVLGGDGSILAIAQELVGMPVPVAGINFGKLGYLAAFSLVQFRESLDLVLAGKTPRTERLMLHGEIFRCNGKMHQGIQHIAELEACERVAQGYALNDVVINAGDPFRMVELSVQIDEHETTTFRSDGVIVSTASGSTGYNLSAGGPLISPAVEAMVLTPICPHSLSFRPVVLACSSTVVLVPRKLNAGSKVNFDGQLTMPLTEHDCVVIRRAPTPLVLVENPTVSHWQMLGQKLHWARSPRQ